MSGKREGADLVKWKLGALPLGDFDRTGYFPIWRLAKLFEGIRFIGFRVKNLLRISIGQPQLQMVSLVSEYYMFPVWYQDTRKFGFEVPVTLTMNIVGAGRSSILLVSELRNTKTSSLYACVVQKMVNMNKFKGIAKPLSETVRQNLQNMIVDPKNLVRELNLESKLPVMFTPPSSLPAHRITREVVVVPSDLDFNFHMNNSQYITICMDSATIAVEKGSLSQFKTDICWYHVKTMRVFYTREAKSGDKLSVSVWENPGEKLVLYFQVSLLEGESPVFYAVGEFYPLASAKY